MRIEPLDFLEVGWNGLVIAESIWETLTNKSDFQPYCPGYFWQPYKTLSMSGW